MERDLRKVINSLLALVIGIIFILPTAMDYQSSYMYDIYGSGITLSEIQYNNKFDFIPLTIICIVGSSILSLLSFLLKSDYLRWFVTINYILFGLTVLSTIYILLPVIFNYA